ncbi:unnamed protein product [Tetraodon nigroviridis]|uniref:P2X purinoceptor n=1 Tax=Tetraodon nigroviridis TaxID=99883 RepID=Q4RPM9_TETNG|nr:unnamed protein product [Tetraodon nigroviridis]
MMLWNRKYQEFDLVVSSVTTKVKGVAQTNLSGAGEVVWDVADYSGPGAQSKNSFFVLTNVIVTRNQTQGTCPELPKDGRVCRTDRDCEKGASDLHSHGIQTGKCVRFDALTKTCEVSAWCPIETGTKPPRPALLAAAENFTVLIKNNIRFPTFNYTRRVRPPSHPHTGKTRFFKVPQLVNVVSQEEHSPRDERHLPEELPEGERLAVSHLQTGGHGPRGRGELPRHGSGENVDFFSSVPGTTTGGRHRDPDQVGLQPGPAAAPLPPQVLLQTAGREGEQPDALPWPELQVRQVQHREGGGGAHPLQGFWDPLRCHGLRTGREVQLHPAHHLHRIHAVVLRSDDHPDRLAHRNQLLLGGGGTQLLREEVCPPRVLRGQARHLAGEEISEEEFAGQQTAARPAAKGGRWSPQGSSVSARPRCRLRQHPPPADRTPRLVQVCRLRPHPGPPGAAVLQVERRHLHHLLASVPAAGAEPLHAGGRPPLPGPPVSPPRGAGPDRQPGHSAYRQYICWRFGGQAEDEPPVIPRCCVRRIREEYPSPDGCYSGFRPERTATVQVLCNGGKACSESKARKSSY